jgi:hypothetical protein
MHAMKKSFWILMIWCCNVAVLEAEPLKRIEIRDAVKRKAVCNDGSPGIYYFRPGTGTGPKRWVIFLECIWGWCTGPYCPGTSLDRPETIGTRGLLSNRECQNPDFYNANHVVLINCTRDMYSGNAEFIGGAGPVQFRGRILFRSMIQDLIDMPGSTLNEPGAEVLLFGASCGGIGVMIQLDWLAQKLPNAKVRGLNDSGWMFHSKTPGWLGYDYAALHDNLETAIQIWKAEVDESCALANPSEKSNCFFPSAYPFVKTPLFIQFTQWDYHFVAPDSSARTRKFASDVRHSLEPVSAAFSSQYFTSVVAYRKKFNSLRVNGYTMADLVGNWFFDRAGPVKQISTVPNSVMGTCGPDREREK